MSRGMGVLVSLHLHALCVVTNAKTGHRCLVFANPRSCKARIRLPLVDPLSVPLTASKMSDHS